jgi:sugar transferase (PEP-CTERM system associated)
MVFGSYNGRATFLFLSENLALIGSIFAAALIKTGSALSMLDFRIGLGKALFAAIIFQVSLYFHDLYDLNLKGSRIELVRRLASSILVASIGLGVVYTLFPNMMLTRGTWFLTASIGLIVLYIWRLWVEKINSIAGLDTPILIVGTSETAVSITKEILERRHLGLRICGFIGENSTSIGQTIIKPRVLGTMEDLESIVARLNIKHILIALRDRRGRLPVESLLNLKLAGIEIEEGALFYERAFGKLPVEELNPSYLVFSNGFKVSKFIQFYKRIFSIVFSIIGLIFSSPLMLLTAIAIKLDSRGPVFFFQERVGKKGRVFKLIKFRSMYADAEARTGPVWAQADDPRITRVGQFIRRTRLDELPQFVNVLRGDMHFVGPRPERPYFVEQLRKSIPYYWQRHTVEPGLTGWAQVKYSYGSTIEEAREKLKYDLYYIKNVSLLLDLWIIFQTVKIVLLGRGAR